LCREVVYQGINSFGWAALQQRGKFKKAIRIHIAIGLIGVALMTFTPFYLLPYIFKYLAPKFELEIQMGATTWFIYRIEDME